MKHIKTFNWGAVRIALFTLIGYFAAMCVGCFTTAMVECGGYRDGVIGIVLAVFVILLSQYSILKEKGE